MVFSPGEQKGTLWKSRGSIELLLYLISMTSTCTAINITELDIGLMQNYGETPTNTPPTTLPLDIDDGLAVP
jgi:hypothetical protein